MKLVKKLLAFVLVCAILVSVAACTGSQATTGTGDPTTTAPISTPKKEPTMILNDLVKPFWTNSTMYDESVMLIAKTDADGNVIEAPKAKLLFAAESIQAVTWYFHENNGGKTVTFTEGVDFTYQDGYITAIGSITHNDILGKDEFTGTMPYVTDKQLTGEQQFPKLTLISDIPSKTEGLYLPFTEGYQIVQMQLSVSYTHAENAWNGSVPAYLGSSGLAHTVEKLKNKETVELFVYGDSISTGANSSSILGIAPNMGTWMQLLAENLGSWYGAKVNLTNKSVGGWTSSNGVGGGNGWVSGQPVNQMGLSDLFASGDLRGYVPDVAIIGFGMNDATMGLSLDTYCNNIIRMIDELRRHNPDCDIILLGTMLANPMAKNQSKNQTEYTSYLSKVADRYENVSVVDIGAMHQNLLGSGKHYTEMSGNNVNHPNDFMARVYAMNLLASFIDFGEEGTGGEEIVKDVYEQYIANGYKALFADPYIKNGISVISADGSATSVIGNANATAAPAWCFAQWGTKYDLSDYANREYFNGGNAYTYISEGKKINGVQMPGKVLTVDSDKGSVYMELNAQTEYDAPRKDGENWPHTLLSQDFGGELVHVSELSDLVMHMDYTITKFEDCMGDQADDSKHCAQLVWYITLQNRTPGHKDYGSYVWFGITLWDNRISGQSFGGYAAEDAGKADATHAYIYQPSSKLVFADGLVPKVGQAASVDFHLLSVAQTAFNVAKERGYLGDTQWSDIYIGAMNFGFENTGTYNTAVQIDSVGVYYKEN